MTSAKREQLRAQLRRRAVGLEIGGFRPSGDAFESYFGRVSVCAPGEAWPESDGKPLHALCQINVTTLPFRPPRLEDVEFLTIFIAADDLPVDTPNGEGWCLRAYKNVTALVSLTQRETSSHIKPFPMRPRIIENDFPCPEDIPIQLPTDILDHYRDLFSTEQGTKLGGWPFLAQAEVFWAPHNRHPAAPEYVFQIDSEERAHWMWGDTGFGYFGRGTAPGHKDTWALSWQCY